MKKAAMIKPDAVYLLVIPALILLLCFFIYPIFLSFQLSFTKFKGVGVAEYAGLYNYERFLSRDRYWQSVITTLKFSATVVIIQNLAGLFLASMLHRLPAVQSFCRAALFMPAMMSFVVVGYVWQFIYSPFSEGLLNNFLGTLGFGEVQIAWLGEPAIALYAIALVHIWMFTGYSTAIFLAGYASIPKEIEEAGRLDGTSSFKRFRYLELPMLAPSITVNIVLATIGTLKTFELPFIMTQGGPDGASRTLSLEIINQLFKSHRFGFASALSIIMLIIVVVISLTQTRLLRKNEDVF